MYCRQFSQPLEAFGLAVNLLRRVEPFSAYAFGRFSNVLMGQIQRGHYVFTFAEERPVGYAGWALCDESVARAWIEQRAVPSFADCSRGDCAVVITFYAESREACFFQARWCRARYPNAKVFAIRDYGEKQRPAIVGNRGDVEGPAQSRSRMAVV